MFQFQLDSILNSVRNGIKALETIAYNSQYWESVSDSLQEIKDLDQLDTFSNSIYSLNETIEEVRTQLLEISVLQSLSTKVGLLTQSVSTVEISPIENKGEEVTVIETFSDRYQWLKELQQKYWFFEIENERFYSLVFTEYCPLAMNDFWIKSNRTAGFRVGGMKVVFQCINKGGELENAS